MNLNNHPIIAKIHHFLTLEMSKSNIVNNYLIAQVEENGEKYDCIYCTILRNMVLFTCIGFLLGLIVGWFICQSI